MLKRLLMVAVLVSFFIPSSLLADQQKEADAVNAASVWLSITVVIQYDTSFQNKASAIETVTPSLEKDGVWRVSGYFVK